MPKTGLAAEVAQGLHMRAAPVTTLRESIQRRLPAAREGVRGQWETLSSGEGNPRPVQLGEVEQLAQVLAYLSAQRPADGSPGQAFPGVECEEVTEVPPARVVYYLRVLLRALSTLGKSR